MGDVTSTDKTKNNTCTTVPVKNVLCNLQAFGFCVCVWGGGACVCVCVLRTFNVTLSNKTMYKSLRFCSAF